MSIRGNCPTGYGRLILYLALITSLKLASPTTTEAATGPWSAPVVLSDSTRMVSPWFPDVAADDSGNAYVIWNAEYRDPGQFDIGGLWLARWNGTTWTKPNDIATIWSQDALRNSFISDAAGRLYLLYKGFGANGIEGAPNSGQEDIFSMSAPGATAMLTTAWTSPVRMTESHIGYFSDIAIDSKGTLHAIWTENDGTGKWGIYYAHSTDGGYTWSDRIPLDASNPVWWYRAHLKIDQQDRLYVVWETLNPKPSDSVFGTLYRTYLATSDDGGRSWSRRVFADLSAKGLDGQPVPAGPQQPTIGIDGSGSILFVYRDPMTEQIMYSRSSDGETWSGARSIPGVRSGVMRPYDIYDMATDSAGHVHIVMVGYPGSSDTLSLLHSEWDGKSWSAPDVIYSGPLYPEYPHLAIGQGNHLYVSWFDGDRGTTDRTPVDVEVSSAVTNSPPVSRAGRPVPVGAPMTVAPTPLPTVTPVVNVASDDGLSVLSSVSSVQRPWYGTLLDALRDPAVAAFVGPLSAIPLIAFVLLVRSLRINRRRLSSDRQR